MTRLQDLQTSLIQFCRGVIDDPNGFFPLLFSDEASMMLNYRQGIWRTCHFHPNLAFVPIEQQGLSQMIWAAIGPNSYKSDLIVIDGVINVEYYQNVLEENQIIENMRQSCGGTIRFIQDNAPPHTAKSTQEFLNDAWANQIKWPAKSPELNPIEQVWSFMKKQLKQIEIHRKEDLINAFYYVWDLVTPNLIRRFYTSFFARWAVCLENGVESLNGH